MFSTLSAFKAHSYFPFEMRAAKIHSLSIYQKVTSTLLLSDIDINAMVLCTVSVQVTPFMPDFKFCHPNTHSSLGQWMDRVA